MDANTPSYNPETGRLVVGERIVKWFRTPAPNQRAVLAAFEEEGWPERINDPLVPAPEIAIKERLGDTIRSLNRNQLEPLIRFRGDGTGKGVLWELT